MQGKTTLSFVIKYKIHARMSNVTLPATVFIHV